MAEDRKHDQPFEHLIRSLQEDETRRISRCIQEIDHRLVNCSRALDEYRKLRSTLRTINGKLSNLGVEPLALPGDIAADDLSEIIRSRIAHFKTTGKI